MPQSNEERIGQLETKVAALQEEIALQRLVILTVLRAGVISKTIPNYDVTGYLEKIRSELEVVHYDSSQHIQDFLDEVCSFCLPEVVTEGTQRIMRMEQGE